MSFPFPDKGLALTIYRSGLSEAFEKKYQLVQLLS